MENEEKNLSEEGLGDIIEEQGKALTETLKEQQNPQDPNTVEKELEERAKEKELGLLAKQKLKEWLVGDITLKSYGTDKYGRVLGDIFCEKGNVAELLKKENLAVDYFGGTKVKKWGE